MTLIQTICLAGIYIYIYISEITDKLNEEIIFDQLDIKLRHFMKDGLYTVLKTTRRKITSLNEIPPEVWKP